MDPRRIAGRAVESTAAVALFVLALPLMAVGVVLALAYYRAWPFFVHERVGIDGERFRLFKIRTLPPETDRYADKFSIGQSKLPRPMQLVRRLHLDEFPQLLHVATGTMAFVGPRPEMPGLHAALPRSFAAARTSIRPGLTCLWQISPHNTGLIGDRPEYDELYVQHRSPQLDLWIAARTVSKMTLGRTSDLDELPHWALDTGRTPSLVAPTHLVGPEAGRPAISLVD